MADPKTTAIPPEAKPAGEIEMLHLLLAVRAWTDMQTRENTAALYAASLRYWGVSPVFDDAEIEL